MAAGIVALGAAGIALLPQFGLQILVELTIGAAVTVFPPATAAFALGLVEENAISQRVARNETFTHTGNVVFAVIAGVAGTFIALASISILWRRRLRARHGRFRLVHRGRER
jgi:hypothetical protein